MKSAAPFGLTDFRFALPTLSLPRLSLWQGSRWDSGVGASGQRLKPSLQLSLRPPAPVPAGGMPLGVKPR